MDDMRGCNESETVIKLSQGKESIIDLSDVVNVSQYKWYANWDGHNYYAVRNVTCLDGKRRKIGLHNFLIGVGINGFEVDHINGQTLDNRRSNLRLVTHRENTSNRKEKREQTKTSRYVGVHLEKRTGHWIARIQKEGNRISLGSFRDQDSAYYAYQRELNG